MRSVRPLALVAVMLVASLDAAPSGGAEPSWEQELERQGLIACDDVEELTAQLDLSTRPAISVAQGGPRGEVKRWAKVRPGYEGIWNTAGRGWLVVAFSEGIDEVRAELANDFPGAGVLVVEVEHPKAVLLDLQGRIVDRLRLLGRPFGVGVHDVKNIVSINLVLSDVEALDIVATRFAGEPICLETPLDVPTPGPQRDTGWGWRLIGHRQGDGPPYDGTAIATDAATLDGLWREAGMSGAPPAIDFEREAVLWFTAPYSSGCPERRLDEIITELRRAIIYPIIVDPLGPRPCRLDLVGAWQYFVAVGRDRLPEEPFGIWSGAFDPPPESAIES